MLGEHASAPIDLAGEPQFVLGGVHVHPATLEVRGDPGRAVLEPRVMQVLVALARSADEVVSRDVLIQACWGGRIVGDDAINRCIGRLRRVSDRFGGFAIETVPRVGYRLSGTCVLEAQTAAASGGKPSIAVLPFANFSDDAGQDYFADGMVEEITTALTRFRSLFVIAGGSGLSLKGQGLTPQEAGRRLGVRYLLDGAVRRAGDRVRISVSLIDARDGVQLWADRFDREMADIFALQDDVALSAAARIEPQVQAQETRRAHAKPAASLDAYDLFLRAQALAESGSPEGMQQALPYYERCLQLDPDNARALAWCALRLADLVSLGGGDVDLQRRLARERVHAALRLAPGDPEVLAVAAVVLLELGEDPAAARALADEAIAANPGSARGWRASGCLRALLGEADIAAQHLEHCLKLDPLSPLRAASLTALGMARLQQHRVEDAIAQFRQSAQLASRFPTNYVYLAACYSHLKQFAEASEAAAHFRAITGQDVREFARRVFAGSEWMLSRLTRIPDA